MEISVWMTLAPREKEEVNQTIASFRKVWFKNKIHIYAEPWEYNIKYKNIELNIHKEKKGCFKNFDYTFKQLIKKKTDYILILQDDFLIQKWAKKNIEKVISVQGEKFWFISLNTRHYWNYLEEELYKKWWNQNTLGWRFSPAFFLFSRWGARQIVKHPFYINHLENYKKNQQVDSCIWETCKQLWLEMYNHNPSLSIQRWETSTLWHNPIFIQEEAGYKETELIYWWIATIPSREESLKVCLSSILLQVDKLFIALNWYKEVPKWLKDLKKQFNIDIRITDNSRGDIEKFYWVDKLDWYYFTFDDDLEYKPTYTKELIWKLEKYWRKYIVWLHWAKMLNPIEWYYKSRKVFWYNRHQWIDYEVNILWTWTTAFHTETIKPNINLWENKNMTDIYLWIEAQNKKVNMICLAHDENYIKTINESQKDSIFSQEFRNDSIQTELVKSIEWRSCKFESKVQIKKPVRTTKVKLLRPIYPYKSWEIMEMALDKVYYFRNQLEIFDKSLIISKSLISN